MTNIQHNDIVVLMIPEFVDIGSTWRVLPAGIHKATLAEVREHFATNDKRKQLFRGLEKACIILKAAGCKTIYLDGSYVTEKDVPTDYDVCWNSMNVDTKKLDPLLYDTTINGRKKQKDKYGGEFFPANALADGSHRFIRYFQTDKDTGLEKGIISINL